MSNRKKSFINLASSVLGQIITIAFGLVLPRFILLSYGSETNGLLNSLSQFLAYFSLFEAGIGAVALQALYGPAARNDHSEINGILSATHYYYKRTSGWYLGALIGLSLIYPIVVKSEIGYATTCGVVFFSGIGNVILFYYHGKYKVLLQAEGKNYVVTNSTTIISTLVSLSKVYLILCGANIVVILATAFFIQSIQAVYINRYVRKNYAWISLAVEPNFHAIEQRNYMLIHQISYMIFQNTDVLILTFVSGLRVVSVYSMYKLVITHLEGILRILIDSINFVLGQTFQTNKGYFMKRIDAFESYYSAVSFSLFSVALFIYVPFMKLYTANIADVNYVDYNLALLFVAIALLTVMRTPMLLTINYAGHFKLTTPQTVVEAIINLVVSILGVVYFGIYGVLLGTVVAMIYRTNEVIIYANKKILNRQPWRTYATYLVNIVVLVALQGAFPLVFRNAIDTYWRLAAVGVVATILSVLVFVIAQSIFFSKNVAVIKQLLKKRG